MRVNCIKKKKFKMMQELTEKLFILSKKQKILTLEKTNINLDSILKEVIDNLIFAYPKQK